jgi:hypothetical protein
MKWKILIILVLSLVVLGCGETSESNKDVNYKTGFVDLNVDIFGTNKGYQGSQLDQRLLIRNSLGYDVENVQVEVGGFDRRYLDFFLYQQEFSSIEGRSVFNPAGGRVEMEYNVNIITAEKGAKDHKQKYRIYLGYNSKLELSDEICISPGSYLVEDENGCQKGSSLKEGSNSISSGQGAPLGITEMEVISKQGETIELRMKIENKGDGDVKTVSLQKVTIGGKEITCKFRGSSNSEVTIVGKEGIEMNCQGNLRVRRSLSYKTPLLVELSYKYELSFQKELIIGSSDLIS